MMSRSTAAAKLAGTVTARQERRSKKGNPFAFLNLSDPTGQFEMIVFSEVLAASRDVMEPGKSVVVSVEIDRTGDEVRLRALGVQPLEAATANVEEGMKVFIEDPTTLEPLKARLKERGKGIVSLVLLAERGREVEIELKDRYRVTPEIRGAIKSMAGIVEVQEI